MVTRASMSSEVAVRVHLRLRPDDHVPVIGHYPIRKYFATGPWREILLERALIPRSLRPIYAR